MRAVYYAYDGTEFDDKEECLEYEACHTKGLYAFDEFGRPLDINEIGLEKFVDRVTYVKCETDDAAANFNDILEAYDADAVLPDAVKGIFYMDDYYDEWKWFEEEYAKLNKIAEFFGVNKK